MKLEDYFSDLQKLNNDVTDHQKGSQQHSDSQVSDDDDIDYPINPS